jgi:hypothetical protein
MEPPATILAVMGIIGYTQGVKLAKTPPRKAATKDMVTEALR